LKEIGKFHKILKATKLERIGEFFVHLLVFFLKKKIKIFSPTLKPKNWSKLNFLKKLQIQENLTKNWKTLKTTNFE